MPTAEKLETSYSLEQYLDAYNRRLQGEAAGIVLRRWENAEQMRFASKPELVPLLRFAVRSGSHWQAAFAATADLAQTDDDQIEFVRVLRWHVSEYLGRTLMSFEDLAAP